MFLLFIIFAVSLTYSLVGLVNNAGLISIAEHNLHFNPQNRSDHWKFFDLVIISSEYSEFLFQIRIQAFFSPVNSFLMDDIGCFQVCSRLLGNLGLYRLLHHDYEFIEFDRREFIYYYSGLPAMPGIRGYFSRVRLAGNPWICNNICNS